MEQLEPKSNPNLIGHRAESEYFTSLVISGRLPHAFLITGQKGIGKATFAYKIARFILSGGLEKKSVNLFGEPEVNFDIGTGNPVFSKIQNGSHPDLMVLQLTGEEKEITVAAVRRISSFIRLTSAESGWRVVIIDSAEDMNRNAANALLKILEEPNQKSLLLLLSHSPGMLLPTIRSRTNVIKMKPLNLEDSAKVLESHGIDISQEDAGFAMNVADGAPGFAMYLIENGALATYNNILEIIAGLPDLSISSVIAFSEKAAGKEGAEWEMTNYLLAWLLSRAAKLKIGNLVQPVNDLEREALQKLIRISSIEKLSAVREEIMKWQRADDIFHIDRKVIITNIFNQLKQAA